MGSWPTPAGLKYEIWDLDYIQEIIGQGFGSSFTNVFGTGGHDDGDCEVRFYVDNNENGDYDSSDPHKYSPTFKAQELTYHFLDVSKSSLVNGTPATAAACSTATNKIRGKDDILDCRATAMIMTQGDLQFIPFTGHEPLLMFYDWDDSTLSDIDGHAAYFMSAYANDEVIIVDNIQPYDEYGLIYEIDIGGFSRENSEVIIQNNYLSGGFLAHELGHSYGLEHNNSSINNIMHETSFLGSSTLLVEDQIDNYE